MAMAADLQAALPKTLNNIVTLSGACEVPKFDAPIDIGDGIQITIAPPLDKYGRETYVSSVCAPMASMKSLRARCYAWGKEEGITVVIAGRISYALNAAQEWRESAPGAKEQDVAARTAFADYDELDEHRRREVERFGPETHAPARVWCYLTHTKEQLEALFHTGHGVCIISPNFSATFLQWIRDMDSSIRIEQLYVEEVMGLAQMWNTKVLRSVPVMEAMRSLATHHSRRVFGFCADFLFPDDDRPAILMKWCTGDRPHYVFNVPNARSHMKRDVCIFHELEKAEKAAFHQMYDQLLAAMVRHPDFLVWHTISYEKLCINMYTRAVELGIRSILLIGNADGEEKLKILTNFDHECRNVQAIFATSVIRDGVNSKRKWSAVVAVTGPKASGPITHGQAAGRGGRVDGLEFNTILWLLLDTKPPTADEQLTSRGVAEKRLRDREQEKERHAQRNRLKSQSTPKLLVDLAVLNEKEKADVRSHCALYTRTLVNYKPGWTLVNHADISLPPRVAAMTPAVVEETFAAARPLHESMIQKIDSASPREKMHLGLYLLLLKAQAKYEAGECDYAAAEKEVRETCDGMFDHSHTASTYQHGKRYDAQQVCMIKAWKAIRHFSSLDKWKPDQLLLIEKHEDPLNLAACHLTLGVRGVVLARRLLSESQTPDTGVSMYTHLPERLGALEQACKIIGVSNLSKESTVLTAEHHHVVRLLQAEKMGDPSVEVEEALKELRVHIDVAVHSDRSPTHGTKTLWDALRSLLGCVCSVAKVIDYRRMTAAELKAWEERNDCTSSSALARAAQVPGLSTNAELDDALIVDSSEEEEEEEASADVAPKPATSKPKAKKKRQGANVRLPVKIMISRRKFHFLPDGTPVKADKVTEECYEVDFVPQWRVFSYAHGESKPAHMVLRSSGSASAMEKELESLLAGPTEERFEVSLEERKAATAAAAATADTQDIVTRMMPRAKDGEVMVEEPLPAEAFRYELMRHRQKKKDCSNSLCTQQVLESYENAPSKADKQRLERNHEQRVRQSLGPRDTARLQWLEAMDKAASPQVDKHGLRWNVVKYRVKHGVGREMASWPSTQFCEGSLRKDIFGSIMHDWDIVSCHFFLSEAVVAGLLELEAEAVVPTIYKYNRACEEDLRTGRGKEGNTFLVPIAEFYGVTVSEAKMGCHILHNQGTVQTWLQKELDPPRDVPNHHPDDVVNLMAEAVKLRKLFIENAGRLFGREAFHALQASLLRERPDDGSRQSCAGMERSIFGYCMQHLENTATAIAMKTSSDFGQPAITRIYDGFGQLHVDGKDQAAFKATAEARLLDHFKSPIYLTEKHFYRCPSTPLFHHGGGGEEDSTPPVDHDGGGGESGEDDSSDENSMESSGEESDNGDDLPDNGLEIDAFEARSDECEEPNSSDQEFIASSDEGEDEGDEERCSSSDEAMSDESVGNDGNTVSRKRALELLEDDDEN